MKRTFITMITALMLVFSATSFAGDGEGCSAKKAANNKSCSSKMACSAPAEKCLEKMTAHFSKAAWDGIWVEGIGLEKVVVSKVEEGSAGATAGIQKGDVLVAMNGTQLASLSAKDFNKVMGSLAIGQEVTYKVKRGHQKEAVKVTMTGMPKEQIAQQIGQHMMSHAKTHEPQVASN